MSEGGISAASFGGITGSLAPALLRLRINLHHGHRARDLLIALCRAFWSPLSSTRLARLTDCSDTLSVYTLTLIESELIPLRVS